MNMDAYQHSCHSSFEINANNRSLTFVPVGPVMTKSPSGAKKMIGVIVGQMRSCVKS